VREISAKGVLFGANPLAHILTLDCAAWRLVRCVVADQMADRDFNSTESFVNNC
jgi:hypothetical protein